MRLFLKSTLLTLFIGTLFAWAGDPSETTIMSLLQESGATQYAVNNEYGGGIEKLYLGYNAEGTPIVGVATRMTKAYKKVLTIIAVVPEGELFKISQATLPEGTKLPGASKGLTINALKDITGKTFADEASTKSLVDATTGATKYVKQIYVSYSLMAKSVIKELKANPTWPKKEFAEK